MSARLSFWQVATGVVARPLSTFRHLQDDEKAGLKGLWILLLVLGVYTLVLGIFIVRDYPAAAPSILPLSVDQQYRVQILYQGPLFLASTLLLTGLLLWLAKANRREVNFGALFARVSFATTVPFALTTMLVELVIALLVLARAFTPQETLGWLSGDGLWFANAYQLGGILWLVGLLVIVAKASTSVRWGVSILLGFLLSAVYAVPIALFTR
jgi:hypothetical protein